MGKRLLSIVDRMHSIAAVQAVGPSSPSDISSAGSADARISQELWYRPKVTHRAIEMRRRNPAGEDVDVEHARLVNQTSNPPERRPRRA